jgi:hypothetical protein
MSGRRVAVERPRVRQGGAGVPLPSWEEFADEDLLNERTVEQMMLGVSTRGYERSIEELPDEPDGVRLARQPVVPTARVLARDR